jgi:S-adenosyl-L-methionine hydrolase (adenosine-forming)
MFGMKSRHPIITLTTDFGLHDWFVGTMKGVMLGLAPQAQIIDISHSIAPGSLRAGAFSLRSAFRYFPPGTIHVGVVDPGVGSDRRAIAVRTRNYLFVGPDNGLLSCALDCEEVVAVHALKHSKYFLPQVSRTFHGRDVFAPVAAHLANGLPIAKLGGRLADYVRLSMPAPAIRKASVVGEVLYIDQFGNALTNLDAISLSDFICRRRGDESVAVYLRRQHIGSLSACYASVPKGRPVAVIGSSGFLEIAVNGGHAARALKISLGDLVTVGSARASAPA